MCRGTAESTGVRAPVVDIVVIGVGAVVERIGCLRIDTGILFVGRSDDGVGEHVDEGVDALEDTGGVAITAVLRVGRACLFAPRVDIDTGGGPETVIS